jgi:hypothetical protein
MTVDYVEWESTEKKTGFESARKILEDLAKERDVRLTSLFPEFKLKPEDTFTTWAPPGNPGAKLSNPQANLGNLVTLYNRILVPIHCHPSKQDFAYRNAMSLEDLTQLLKENPSNYIPIAMAHANDYRASGFYDDLLQTCRDLYGHYPVPVVDRSMRFQKLRFVAAKAAMERRAIPIEDLIQRFPDIDIGWVQQNVIDQIARRDVKGLDIASSLQAIAPLDAKRIMATAIVNLRIHGHEDLVKFVLENFGGRFDVLTYVLLPYARFLVEPTSLDIGGFGNYTTEDLEIMAFLRVLPLVAKDLRDLDKTNLKLLFNSPGARSTVNLESYKMRVFLKGGDDINTLNQLVGFAEHHKKETRVMSEYKQFIAAGKLGEATEAIRKSGEVYKQISEEVMQLAKKEKTAKLATYSMTGGATILSDLALVLQQGLPLEWKLVIMLFKDLFGSRIKDMDPKRVVEWIYDSRQWPWYEKGIPYLYWKAVGSSIPPAA